MRFMAVQGVGYWLSPEDRTTVHILVTGDDRTVVTTIRDEAVPVLAGERSGDLDWQVDQYTQETIGVTLAEDGWEVFSTSDRAADPADGPGSSLIYLVRR